MPSEVVAAGNLPGPYVPRRILGQGGQGVVWLAEDPRDGGQVALKLLSGPGARSPELVGRFRREAGISSRLKHPGICEVYESDFSGPEPWIAMRFVEGDTLAHRLATTRKGGHTGEEETTSLESGRVVADVRSRSGGPRPSGAAAIAEMATLVAKTARALHAAHEAGVIHRDLKPGNIMVTVGGEPVVLDFGLARIEVADAPSLTLTGELFGTPAYMSPEQLTRRTLRIDRRTDVWSLGVVLYEALTLRRPFDAPTREGLYQAILTGEPPDPRRWLPRFPRALKAILETALQKDRDRRYQTAEALANDLEAFVAGEAVAARALGPAGRLVRWSRREPARAALLLTLLVALPAIAVLVTLRIADAPRVAAARRAETDLLKDDLLAEGYDELGERGPGRASGIFERVLAMEGGSPEAAAGLVLVRLRENDAAGALSALDRFARHLGDRRSASLLRADALRLAGREDEAEAMAAAAPSAADPVDHHLEGERLLEEGHRGRVGAFAEAVRSLNLALLLSTAPRALHLDVFAHAAGHSRDARTVEDAVHVLRTRWPRAPRKRFRCGWALGEVGRLEEAIVEFRVAISHARIFPTARVGIGQALQKLGRLDEAADELRQAIALHPEWSMCHSNLGAVLIDQGKLDEAEAAIREALSLDAGDADARCSLAVLHLKAGRREEAVAGFQEALRLRPAMARARRWLGDVHFHARDYDRAIVEFGEAVRLTPFDPASRRGLGSALREKGRLDEALAEFREALRLDPSHAGAHAEVARIALGNGAVEESLTEFRQALQRRPDHLEHLLGLADAALRAGRPDEAVDAYRSAILRQPGHAQLHNNLGLLFDRLDRADDAEAAWREAIRLDPGLAEARSNLGILLRRKGRRDEALVECRESVRLKPEYPEARVNLGVLLKDQGRLDEALAEFGAAVRLNPRHLKGHTNLGTTCFNEGWLAEAAASYRETVRLAPRDWANHFRLAQACNGLGLHDEALAAAREGVRLAPEEAVAQIEVASALLQLGRFAEALPIYRKGHELGVKSRAWRHPSEQWIATCEENLRREERLAAMLAEGREPEGPPDLAAFASVALLKGRHVEAVRWYRAAFAGDPGLADDPSHRHRRRAALAAAKAAAGPAEEDPPADYHALTLRWLEEDVGFWERRVEAGRARSADFRRALSYLLAVPALAPVRDEAARPALPAGPREAWAAFWAGVRERIGTVPAAR